MTERAYIFNAVREMLGRGFTQDEVKRLDRAIDAAVGIAEDAFEAALSIILKHEGGFVNHPRDPGGMTNLGVTRKTWQAWTGKAVGEADMRALTRSTVAPLYRKNYWDAVSGDKLPGAVALCVFDFAVNAGPSRSAKVLQEAVGVGADGKIGPATIAAIERDGPSAVVTAFQEARKRFYRSLPTFPTFGKGWLRRVDEVTAAAKSLL